METIIPIISVIFFLAFMAHRLNRASKSSETTSEEINNSHDEIIASMYDSAHDDAEKTYKKFEQQMDKE